MVDKQNLTIDKMKEETVTTREFLRNYKKYAAQNKTIIITSNGKPDGAYVPYKEWEKEEKNKRTKFSLEDLDKITFKGGGKIRENIDKIVYDL